MIATGLILQQVSFAFPAALLLYRKRSAEFLPANRGFKLGVFGWVANVLTVVFAIVCLIFFDFPTVMPVTPNNMSKLIIVRKEEYTNRLSLIDYACAVIGVMAIFTVANWYGYARSNYQGPRIHDGGH